MLEHGLTEAGERVLSTYTAGTKSRIKKLTFLSRDGAVCFADIRNFERQLDGTEKPGKGVMLNREEVLLLIGALATSPWINEFIPAEDDASENREAEQEEV